MKKLSIHERQTLVNGLKSLEKGLSEINEKVGAFVTGYAGHCQKDKEKVWQTKLQN